MKKPVLSESHAALVKRMYGRLNMPLDQLPYTPQFELMYREFIEKTNHQAFSRSQLWHWLANARKAKKLPPLRKSKKTTL